MPVVPGGLETRRDRLAPLLAPRELRREGARPGEVQERPAGLGRDRAERLLRLVGGTIDTGVAWSRCVDGSGPLVVTKPGGFGDEQTLVRVLEAILDT